MSNDLYVTALLKAKSERVDELSKILSTVVLESRKEAGCVEYAMYQSTEDPTTFITIEVWNDADVEAAHWETDHVKNALERLPAVLDGDAVVGKYVLAGPGK